MQLFQLTNRKFKKNSRALINPFVNFVERFSPWVCVCNCSFTYKGLNGFDVIPAYWRYQQGFTDILKRFNI